MKKFLFSLPVLALLASSSAQAQLAFVQISPVTDQSTIVCSNFTKLPDGTWKALAPVPFSLGIINGIVPPVKTIKSGSYIYNNVDLWTQLNYQCGSAVVIAKY